MARTPRRPSKAAAGRGGKREADGAGKTAAPAGKVAAGAGKSGAGKAASGKASAGKAATGKAASGKASAGKAAVGGRTAGGRTAGGRTAGGRTTTRTLAGKKAAGRTTTGKTTADKKTAARKAAGKKAAARKAGATKSGARKAGTLSTLGKPATAATAKTVVPARRKVGPARARPVPRPMPPRAPRAPQRFTVSHLLETSFAEGLRAYAQYRDLGISEATTGLVQAHVIRFVPPCRPEEVSKLHHHDVDFQMIYVLRGWIRSAFAGEGEHVFAAGSCWLQPPRIEHRVLDYSDDCELLEIVMPAEFTTVTLD